MHPAQQTLPANSNHSGKPFWLRLMTHNHHSKGNSVLNLVIWYVRKPGLTLAESIEANHRVHGELTKRGPDDFTETVYRYIQNYPFDAAYGKTGAKNFDGVSELTFLSSETLKANLEHPYYLNTVKPDGQNFADEAANVIHLASEEVVFTPLLGEGIKVIRWLQTMPDADPADFEDFWTKSYDRDIRHLPGLLGYSRNRLPEGHHGLQGLPPTAFDSFWLDGKQDIAAFQQYARQFVTEGQNQHLVDAENYFYLLCEERRVIDRIS